MAAYTTEAIVLKQFDLGEADKIITFYTRDLGKVRAVAKGVRKSKSTISGLVLPFSYNKVLFYKGKSLYRVNSIESIFHFTQLREDLTKMAYATLMAEIVEKLGLEDEPNEGLFSLLLMGYYQLLKADKSQFNYIELIYKIRLLEIIGIKPELTRCVNCNKDIEINSINLFDLNLGGIVCNDYERNGSNEVYKISGESIQILRKLLDSGIKKITKLQMSKIAYQELDKLINDFIVFHLDIRLKSFDFLNMIKDLG